MPDSSLIRSIGIICSSSGDGVEAAIIDTDGRDVVKPIGGVALPYSEQLRWRVFEATQNDLPTTEILRLERLLSEHHLAAYHKLAEAFPSEVSQARLVGFEGHTLRHIPAENLTYAIGNPWFLTEKIGLPVVSDFRRHDMATGGEGAPLAAMFHWALMAAEPRPALMLNLESVASVTWLSEKNEIIAGDTGPGVGLLNEWVQEIAGVSHDLQGEISSRGEVKKPLIDTVLSDAFFQRSLPKAADLHQFDNVDVAGLSVEDGAATLCAITVGSFMSAARKLPSLPEVLWITGPGSDNAVVCRMLEDHFESVKNVRERGLDPNTMAAECFAWLAVRHVKRLPITTPETTNCRSADCAGFITSPLDQDRTARN